MSTSLPVTAIQVPTAFNTIWTDLTNIVSYCHLVQNGTSGGGSIAATTVLSVLTWIMSLNADWANYEANSAVWNALPAYVQNIFANTGVTATTFTNAYNAAQSLATAIETDYPNDKGSPPHLLDRVWSNNSVQPVMLTAAQLPNTMTQITAFLAVLS